MLSVPHSAGERGREMVGAKANILKSEIMGEGRRKRFGGEQETDLKGRVGRQEAF